MGILDRLNARSQFIEVIEWLDDSSNTLLYRFPVQDQEIKNGAQLIVRESQTAVFVAEGQIADLFPPGRYTIHLSSQNLALGSTDSTRHSKLRSTSSTRSSSRI
jgi:membrane protease subunit (stomatin/prohibitin family)